ncbi:MAG: PH domain-containing protein [Alphaproteobacteria bacterium]|nr:PH domain-containing protein [Alphaproteobacteria bacterium]
MKNEEILRNILEKDEKFYWQVTGSVADWKYNPVFLILTICTFGLFLWIVKLIRQYSSYTLTSTRLIIISGIFGRKVDEIELYRMVNSVSTQSLIERWVNIGNIKVDSTDKTGSPIENEKTRSLYMKKIPYPHEVRDSIRDAYMDARNKRGTVLLENFN